MAEGKAETDYRKYLVKDGLRGSRIGVVRRYVDAETGDPQVKAMMEKAIEDLKAQGAEIVDPFVIPEYEKLTDKIGCGDFQKDLNAYLALHAPKAYYKSLSGIVDSGLYLPYIEAQMKRNVAPKTEAQLARGPCVDTYHDPKKIAFRDAVLGEMEKQHVDALVYPTWSNPPRKVGDMKSPAGDNSQVLSPQTGFPAITVPMGFTYDSRPAAGYEASATSGGLRAGAVNESGFVCVWLSQGRLRASQFVPREQLCLRDGRAATLCRVWRPMGLRAGFQLHARASVDRKEQEIRKREVR
jgi:Asp-tRNA(Asn)/Glu-tRNA(Gln) amidotransferase A subunit family amidase